MLDKLQETLKMDSESRMLKAAEDSTKAHAYATEVESKMDEWKQKIVKTGRQCKFPRKELQII